MEVQLLTIFYRIQPRKGLPPGIPLNLHGWAVSTSAHAPTILPTLTTPTNPSDSRLSVPRLPAGNVSRDRRPIPKPAIGIPCDPSACRPRRPRPMPRRAGNGSPPASRRSSGRARKTSRRSSIPIRPMQPHQQRENVDVVSPTAANLAALLATLVADFQARGVNRTGPT